MSQVTAKCSEVNIGKASGTGSNTSSCNESLVPLVPNELFEMLDNITGFDTPRSTVDNFDDSNLNSSDNNIDPNFSAKESLLNSCKRKRNKAWWKRSVKKKLREEGKEYIDDKGKVHSAKEVRETKCDNKCLFECIKLFSENERRILHSGFWKLSDDEKSHYYAKHVTRLEPKRKRTKSIDSRKKFSYQYFFEINNKRCRVCQSFFITTLDISKQKIYYFFKTVYKTDEGIPRNSLKGKHVKKETSELQINEIREHINKFHVMDSHYCRTNSNKQCLEPGLSIQKMYRLYVEQGTNPVKFNAYQKVFTKNFNFSFHKTKKDRCDVCVKFEIQSDINEKMYDEHRKENEECKEERNKDREKLEKDTVVVCYDLQNVFTLPKASSFFYKRKFMVYNLTGYCAKNKKTYCSLWNESQSDQTGNDIASALIAILKRIIIDLPYIKYIILWSDSSIPQNRNHITSLALLKFLESNLQIISITQKFSESGHSQIQELDAVHSTIYEHLKNIEVHGPPSLLRLLSQIKYNNFKLKVQEMQKQDFLNYNKASLNLKFIPYQKVKHILYESKNLLEIKYKIDHHTDSNFMSYKLDELTLNENSQLPDVEECTFSPRISVNKKKDIQSLLPFLNISDRVFFEKILI